jgi:hypothetical protein
MQKNISPVELQSASAFWSTDASKDEIFECIKPPFRHTIRIARNGGQIRHRIELLAQS